MSKYAVMPMSDYENICNAVREKTGKTDLLKSGDISGEVNALEVGTGINPAWTDWKYFSEKNNRNDLVAKLKYTDTSNGINFYSMFGSCSDIITAPRIDTSNGENFYNMFAGCWRMVTIPILNLSKGTDLRYMFASCVALENVTFEGVIKEDLDMSQSSKFTHTSIMSAINTLYNYAGTGTTKTLKLGTTNLAKISDTEKAIATEKGWTLA